MAPDSAPAPRSLSAFTQAVASLAFGKRLPMAVYVLDDSSFEMPPLLRSLSIRLRTRLGLGDEFNVLKFSTTELRCSFLSYPDFFEDPHPSLRESVSVDLATGQVRRIPYGDRANLELP